MKTKKYFANISVNNGTTWMHDVTGGNYRQLARRASKSARANCYVGNSYSWWVWDEDCIIIAAGSGYKTGRGFCYLDSKHLIGERF